MFNPEINQLIKAEEFFNHGYLEEALEILDDESHFKGLNHQKKVIFSFLRV